MYLILGLARSGLAAASFLKGRGIDFAVYDDSPEKCAAAAFEKGYKVFTESDWPSIQTVVVSPGIPFSYPEPHKIIEKARRQGCEIVTDCTLLQRFAPSKKYIGVTGTNGKSTTTALITHVLCCTGIDAVMGGNIGVPALELGLDHDVYVLELSSFQLERSPFFHLDVAVFLNLSEDHLEQHGAMDHYIAAKKRIFQKAKQKILGIDDSYTPTLHKEFSEAITVSYSSPKAEFFLSHLYLKGGHNLQNMLVAYEALRAFGLEHDIVVKGIESFKGLKHRQQYVGTFENVAFINDSKATSAEATAQALKTFDGIYWLLGGKDKSDGIESLSPHFSKIKKAYLFGAAKDRFAQTLNQSQVPYALFERLEEALEGAYQDATLSKSSATILLSPACASFDQYKDFEERGEHFIQHVGHILNKNKE